MAVAWAWAFDTPFKWTKQVASHFGGTRQGMAISWPAPHQGHRRHPHPVPPCHRHRADDPGGDRYQGARQLVDGIKQEPIEGVSMAYTFDKANAKALDQHQTQYFEMARQPRDLPRRLVCQHDAAGRAVGRWTLGRCPTSMPTNGSCTT